MNIVYIIWRMNVKDIYLQYSRHRMRLHHHDDSSFQFSFLCFCRVLMLAYTEWIVVAALLRCSQFHNAVSSTYMASYTEQTFLSFVLFTEPAIGLDSFPIEYVSLCRLYRSISIIATHTQLGNSAVRTTQCTLHTN